MSGRGERGRGRGDQRGGGRGGSSGGQGRGGGHSSGDSGPRPGDWTCTSRGCNANNYARNNECFRCKTQRSGGSAGGQGRGGGGQGSQRSSDAGPTSRPADWTCGKCKFNNYARNDACHRCQTQKSSGGGHGGRDQGLSQGMKQMHVGSSRVGGGGYGASKTKVEFQVVDPPCLRNILASLNATKKHYGWNKSFTSDLKKLNTLPSRKPDSGVQNSERTAVIKLNHYEVKIQLPKEIFHYEVKIDRQKADKEKKDDDKPTPKPEGGTNTTKKKRGKKPAEDTPGPSGDPGGQQVTGQTPRPLPAFLRKAILKHLVSLMLRNPAYGPSYGLITDFSTAIYTKKRLEEGGITMEVDGGQAVGPEEAGTIFIVRITPTAARFNISHLQSIINNMKNVPVTQDMFNLEKVYGTLMRCIQLTTYTPMRRADLINFGSQPHPLGSGLVSYPGYNIMLPITNGWKKFINIEISNMATYMDGPVYNVLADLFGCSVDACRDVRSWRRDVDKATQFLKTTKIVYSPVRGKTFSKVVVRLLDKSVSELKFRIKEKNYETTVYDYFRQTYPGITLNDAHGPCLELKGGNKPMVPVELCKMKAGQSCNRKLDDKQVTKIAEKAKLNPGDGPVKGVFKTGLHTAIDSAVQDLSLNNNTLLNEWGVQLSSPGKDKMHEIEARVLSPPDLCYGKENKPNSDPTKRAVITPTNGQWDIWGQKFEFFTIKNIAQWGILNLHNRTTEDDAMYFAKEISRKAATRNIHLPEKPFYRLSNVRDNGIPANNVRDLTKDLQWFKDQFKNVDIKLTFVLVILPKKGSEVYNHVKQAAELNVGILTQGIVERNIKGDKMDSILGNVMLKINSKLNSTNHIVLQSIKPQLAGSFTIFDLPVMILGADDVEVGPPSYAAITASIDRTCMPYMMEIQAQEKAGKGAAEVIQGLTGIMVKFLKAYRERTGGYIPVKIIYFRDGVGDGQFQEVLRTEMSAIREACSIFGADIKMDRYEPKITFITVQKRHKTRFFLSDRGRITNAEAGTVVDHDIVHPVETDFFLLSHKGLMGTSRPTRYHVLWDDSDLSMNEIQTLAYFLCYMFVRCNKSVKIPAPTYYAHWAAKRAEVLSKGWGESFYNNIGGLNQRLRERETRNNFATNFPMHFV